MSLSHRLKPLVVLGVLFVLPFFSFIAYFSYFNSDVVYLRGGGAPWIMNPEDKRTKNAFPSDFPATYSTTFILGSSPIKAEIAISAVRAYKLTVNGVALSTEAETARANWKFPTRYDIRPYLVPGLNGIAVHVRSEYSITALKAEGFAETAGGYKLSLNSGPSWLVVSDKEFLPMGFVKEPNTPEVDYYPSLLEKLKSGHDGPGSILVFLSAACMLLLICLFPGIFMRVDRFAASLLPAALRSERVQKALYSISVAVIFSILAVMLWHNLLAYEAERTGDYDSHVQYLNHFLSSWRVPTANEGYEMFNPPVYYLTSAVLYRVFGPSAFFPDVVRYGQLVNTISAFLTVVLVFLILRKTLRGRLETLLALAVAATLPVNLYKAPSISGENTFALAGTLAFFLLLLYLEKPKKKFLLGLAVVSGIGLLTRYTALFLFLGVCAGFAYAYWRKAADRKKVLADLALYVSVVLAIAGAYYARNLVVFGRLFPHSGERGLNFARQVPGYRDWNFYTDLTALMVNDSLTKDNLVSSIFAATYATFWFDGQHLFLVYSKIKDSAMPFILISLATLPTALISWGMFRAAGAAGAPGAAPQDSADYGFLHAVFLSTVALVAAAYVLQSYQYPFYSVMKAHYFLFCIAPFMYFLGLGIESLAARSGRVAVSLWILVLYGCLAGVFYL